MLNEEESAAKLAMINPVKDMPKGRPKLGNQDDRWLLGDANRATISGDPTEESDHLPLLIDFISLWE